MTRTSSQHRSKHQEVSYLQNKYENEIKELREQVTELEEKNVKYLQIIGMTASETQRNKCLEIEATREALTFSKRAKENGTEGYEIEILEELEEMLEAQ